jgi:hypothetical protein
LHIEAKDQKYDVMGSPNDVKALWQELQKFQGQAVAKGASIAEIPKVVVDDDASKILAVRFAKGEISLDQYNEMKRALM